VVSVYIVGVLFGFQGSMAILARISDRMIRRSVGGTIGSSDGTTFSGDLFQRLASNARPINKPPCLSRSAFAILKIHCSQGEKESVFLSFGVLFL
jgi:hypothetical protein